MLDVFVHENQDALPSNGEDLINSFLDKRNRAHEIVDEISQKFNELNGLLSQYNSALQDSQPVSLARELCELISTTGTDTEKSSSRVKKRFDCWFWTVAIQETRLEALMSQSQKNKIKDQTSVYKKDVTPPLFDQPTVIGTVSNLLEKRSKVFVDSAVELFQNLDNGFKTNDGICFRKKIILKSAFSGSNINRYSRSNGYLNDLQRIFKVLDGKDPTRDNPLDRHIEANIGNFREFHELDYLHVKVCGNGNVHVKLARQDLVDRLNELIANIYGTTLGYRAAKH